MKPRAVLVMATPCDHHRGDACLEEEEGEERKDEEKKKGGSQLSYHLGCLPALFFYLNVCVTASISSMRNGMAKLSRNGGVHITRVA